jgi:tryptophan synthase alpha chain
VTKSRLETTFANLATARKKALVAYLCVGDPSLDESVELAVAAANAGADVLELGVPFSDPTADGPAIARASQRAIKNGSTLAGVLGVAARVRARVDVPIVLFGYYNPILTMGDELAATRAAAAGIDALLVVDLPPEEGTILRARAAAAGLAVIPLIAPTSDAARIDVVLSRALRPELPRGFVYCVSVTGVTGAPSSAAAESPFIAAREQSAAVRARYGAPVVIGFGIDGGARAREASGKFGEGADGVVVGTALVTRIERGETAAARESSVRDLVAEIRAALNGS